MMQQYAGPLNPGDMAIRANELSPGISALLMKQMRNNAGSGIYQLPVAKQPNPDFYNSALDNVQNNIRTAARTVNAMAPEGERLAFVNPQEEGILKLLGGAGEPEPVTGIPSYYLGESSDFNRPSRNLNIGGGSQGSAFGAAAEKLASRTGRQAYYATDAGSAEAVGKAREVAQRAIEGKSYSTPVERDQALAASAAQPELQTMLGLAKEGAQEKKGFFENLFSTVGKFTPFGMISNALEDYNFKWYLENVDPDMGKKFAALSEAEQEKLKENKYLIPGYDAYWEDRRQKAMEDQMRRSRDDKSPEPVAQEVAEEEEEEEEDVLDFFNYFRRFKQPMSYEDIVKRAYEGSDDSLLETFQEAIDRETT
jgi:hypothetical protein